MANGVDTFRVFVSSTFSDMRQERRLLQERVFPRLEEHCRSRGANFQAMDLRWGILEEQQLQHKTMELCLDEITRCQEVSPKPNFVVLVGDRYGWQPPPRAIPANEMQDIRELLSAGDRQLIDRWFRRDDNAIPAEYVLQPRGSEHRLYADWQPIETTIVSALRRAVTCSNIDERGRMKYFTSATHQEILRGLLDPSPSAAFKPEEHVFAYVRRSQSLPDERPSDMTDGEAGEIDEFGRVQLDALRVKLKTVLDDSGHYREYAASWRDGQAMLRAPEDFCERVYDDLKATIDDRLNNTPKVSELTSEIEAHRQYKAALCLGMTGRRSVLDRLHAYVTGTDSRVLWLTGESGVGKSSILAKFADDLEHARAQVHYRFTGASARSNSQEPLVSSLCEELGRAARGAPGTAVSTSIDPPRIDTLLSLCEQRTTRSKPVILVLDGVDELAAAPKDAAPTWVPTELPRNVRMVVSSTIAPDSNGLAAAVPTMTRVEGEKVLDWWLEIASRRLTGGQRKKILDGFEPCGLPLFLRLIFPAALDAHSYDEDLAFASDLVAAVDGFFVNLERSHGRKLVEKTLGYLVCGRYAGLGESEILDLLVRDQAFWDEFIHSCHPDQREEVVAARRLPVFVWSRLRRDLDPYLAQMDSYGTELLTLFHKGTLMASINKRYLPSGGPEISTAYYHRHLAEYFGSQPLHWGVPALQPNFRKMTEWPWQLVEAGDRWPEALACFRDQRFAQSCLDAGLWWELHPVVMNSIVSARMQGEFGVANQLSDLINGLIAFQHVYAPDASPTHAQQERVWEEQQRTIEAAEELWFKHDPRALALANIGAELFRAGRREEARSLQLEAIAIDPDCELAHYNLGVDALNYGDAPDAREHFNQVLRINPNNRKAKDALEDIGARRPVVTGAGLTDPTEYVREAMVAVNFRGDISGAERLLEEGLARFPGDAKLERALESLHRTFGTTLRHEPPHRSVDTRSSRDDLSSGTRTPKPGPAPRKTRSRIVEGDSRAQTRGVPGHAKTPGSGTPQRSAVKIGKNDPCFCGSGKKYKACHGRRS